MLQILEGGDPVEVERLAQLLDYVDAELLGNCNFEFLQVTGPPHLHPEYALQAWLGAMFDSSAERIMCHGCCSQGRGMPRH